MRKWQEQRWQRRYRQEEEYFLNQLILAAVIGIFSILIIRLPISYALFSTYDQVSPVSFRAATFSENISVRPGNSKTNDSPEDPGPAFDVASIINGEIYLDFGTYPAGNKRNFPSVLIITNISSKPLYLDWYLAGDLSVFFDTQSGLIQIGPNEEYELELKLNTHPDDFPGDYNGILHISAMNGFIAYEIPAELNIYEKKDKNRDKSEILPGKKGDDKDNNENSEGDIDEEKSHSIDEPDDKDLDDSLADEAQESDDAQEPDEAQESDEAQEPDEAQESDQAQESDETQETNSSTNEDKGQSEHKSGNPDANTFEADDNHNESDTDNSDEKVD